MSRIAEAHPRIAASLQVLEQYRWTNALLAVDEDAAPADRGLLAGTVFSAKDVFGTAGLPSTGGSLVLQGYQPQTDAVVVERARRAGSALFAKSNCAEFGIGIHTSTRIGGRVQHPFDPAISPGGSSGGDAVAVATGMVDFALAADYGGSVRWPAQATGVYGLRTTVGLIPRSGSMPGTGATPAEPCAAPPAFWSLRGQLEVVGVLARSPALISRVLSAVSGPDHADWLGFPAHQPPVTEPKRRIAVTYGDEICPVGPGPRAAITKFVASARNAGYEVIDARGVFGTCVELYHELRVGLDGTEDLARLVAGREELCCDGTRALLELPPPPGPAAVAVRDAWARARRAVAKLSQMFESIDAIVLPVAPVRAVAFEGSALVDGHELSSPPELMAHCRAVSLTGLPALSVPVMDDSGQSSIASVQLVGPAVGDWRLCALAEEVLGPPRDEHGKVPEP